MKEIIIILIAILLICLAWFLAQPEEDKDSGQKPRIRVVGYIDIPSCTEGLLPRIDLDTGRHECIPYMSFDPTNIPEEAIIDKGKIIINKE